MSGAAAVVVQLHTMKRENPLLYDRDPYRDVGCDLVQIDPRCGRCSTCPLPACRYDLPPGQARRDLVTHRVRDLLASGMSVPDVARTLGVSRRTVYRARGAGADANMRA